MQKIKKVQGRLTSIGTKTINRYVSYKNANSGMSCYTNKINLINQSIADFLSQDCGVDAAYEKRGPTSSGADQNFLFIYGVPFMFFTGDAENVIKVYGPYDQTITETLSSNKGFFESATSPDYDFSIIFNGNPKTSFFIRFIPYGDSALSSTIVCRFMRGKNILNKKDGLVWFFGQTQGDNISRTTYTPVATGQAVKKIWGVDTDLLDDKNFISENSFTANYREMVIAQSFDPVDYTNNPDKFPLIPVYVGPWELVGAYLHPTSFNIPGALALGVANQTEIEVAGRRFMITCDTSYSNSRANMGMIELADETGEE